MKGFITRTASGLTLCLGLSALGGCYHYRELVDPCWPQRYAYQAAESVKQMHNAQAAKGHLLEQTVWNWMFEADPKTGIGTDHLNAAGMERLRTITRQQPAPDFHLWLQNAQDIPVNDAVPPERTVALRENLNNRRIQAVHRFLATQTNVPGSNFQVAVHDFAPTGIPSAVITGTAPQANGVLGAYQKLENNFQGAVAMPGAGTTGGGGQGSSTSGSGSSGGSGSGR